MKKITRFLILGIVFVLFAFGYYYVTLPAINIHSSGFFNSILSQKDCLQTTNGYNYIALEDDVWE